MRLVLAIGCAADFVLGILLHLSLQNRVFVPADVGGGMVQWTMTPSLNPIVFNNWRIKQELGLVYVGDIAASRTIVFQVLLTMGAGIALSIIARGGLRRRVRR